MTSDHSSARVIQGQFHGGQPAFSIQTGPGFANHAARPIAPHVQAALQRNAPPHSTAQRHTAPSSAAPAQPKVDGNAAQVPTSVDLSANGRGQPLPPALRQKMESVFATSFADVRVHVGPQAQRIGAVAFTQGSSLYFAPGHYNPDGHHGQRLIGHELAHVLQQRAGRVRNPFASGVAVVQDPGLEAEAERMGLRAAQAATQVQVRIQRPIPAAAARPPGTRRVAPDESPTPGGRPPVLQQTPEEKKTLLGYGLWWNKEVWVGKTDASRKTAREEFLKAVNPNLEKLGFKIYTVFQPHDPYVSGGPNKNYKSMIAALSSGTDGGKAKAASFVKWATGDLGIAKLPKDLQELIIIAYVAEVGRGYVSEIKNLEALFGEIAKATTATAAKKLWSEFYKWFPPALKYAEDVKAEWKGEMDSDSDEDTEDETKDVKKKSKAKAKAVSTGTAQSKLPGSWPVIWKRHQ